MSFGIVAVINPVIVEDGLTGSWTEMLKPWKCGYFDSSWTPNCGGSGGGNFSAILLLINDGLLASSMVVL